MGNSWKLSKQLEADLVGMYAYTFCVCVCVCVKEVVVEEINCTFNSDVITSAAGCDTS